MSPDDPTGPESLVLRYLRNIDEKLDRTIMRIDDLTARVAAVEAAFAVLVTLTTNVHSRLDRFDTRLDRIERRLGLLETP
jgi:hypothetical protein